VAIILIIRNAFIRRRFALLTSETTAALLVELAGQGYWTRHWSSYAVEEARRNLERKFPESFEQYGRTGTTLSLTQHHPDYRFPSGPPGQEGSADVSGGYGMSGGLSPDWGNRARN